MRSDVSAESTALYRTAVNLYQQQQYDDATTTLKQISRHSAVFPDALVLQGLLHRTQGDFIAAEVAYQQSLELSPGNIHAHRNLAILYDLYLGQFDNALTHYETCEALAPGQYPELSIWIADLRQRIAQQLIAGAEK
ncbi:MAG: tetratricopeptide repeat protein [Pseudomonadales bacterium]|nr:tetratricopeptide repeat protein [Pseudomonadales bacterium]